MLFDWDDTLSLVEPHRFGFVADLLAAEGIAVSRAAVHQAWAAATRDPGAGLAARLPGALGFGDRPDLAGILSDALRRREAIRRRQVFADVPGSLRYLRGLGLRTGVLSDNFEAVAEVEQHGLAPLLDLVVTPLIAGAMKPAPAIFHVALSVLGIQPAECLYVGDAFDVDVAGARAAGLDCLLIDRFDLDEAVDCRRVSSLDEVLRYVAERRYDGVV